MKKKKTDLSGFSLSRNQTEEIAEPGTSLDAENVCGLTGKFMGGSSELVG